MQLKTSRITDVADFDITAAVEFEAFVEDGGHNTMIGRNTPSCVNATRERQKKEFTSDPSNFWIKVIDQDANDRIVAASNWKIFPTYVESEFKAKDEHINALAPEHLVFMEDEKRQEDAVIAIKGFMGARHRNTREAHIVLNLLFVDPKYNRRGAGRLMVEWGNQLADTLMVPAWVEASKQGYPLYLACGYEVFERLHLQTKHDTWEGELDYPLMRRPVKVLFP